MPAPQQAVSAPSPSAPAPSSKASGTSAVIVKAVAKVEMQAEATSSRSVRSRRSRAKPPARAGRRHDGGRVGAGRAGRARDGSVHARLGDRPPDGPDQPRRQQEGDGVEQQHAGDAERGDQRAGDEAAGRLADVGAGRYQAARPAHPLLAGDVRDGRAGGGAEDRPDRGRQQPERQQRDRGLEDRHRDEDGGRGQLGGEHQAAAVDAIAEPAGERRHERADAGREEQRQRQDRGRTGLRVEREADRDAAGVGACGGDEAREREPAHRGAAAVGGGQGGAPRGRVGEQHCGEVLRASGARTTIHGRCGAE